MIKRNIFAVLGISTLLAAPVASADSNLDIDPYWKWSKIERTAASDTRTGGTTKHGTAADAVANPGNYYY
jgi:hypothetical protein